MGYRRPSKRASGRPYPEGVYNNWSVPTEYMKLAMSEPFMGPPAPPGGGCKHPQDAETVSNGCVVCTACGAVKGQAFASVPHWYGSHSEIRKHCYDPGTHMNACLAPLAGAVPSDILLKIKAVFPLVFRGFFRAAPQRKNFLSYPFVIEKLLGMQGVDTSALPLKRVKTRSRLKQNELLWDLTMDEIKLHL